MNGVPYSALMLCLERDADLHMAQLYCLGDMLSVYGNADAAVEARIIIV